MLIQRSLKSWLCAILIITFTCLSVFAVATQPSFAFSQADVDKLAATKICVRCDLSDADLSGADLSGAKLGSANLSNANLNSANLNSANLNSANLSNANLSNANLSNANLSRAKLDGANLDRANLDRAILNHVELWKVDLRNTDLDNAFLYNNILTEDDKKAADREKRYLDDERDKQNQLIGRNLTPGYTNGRVSPNSAEVRSSVGLSLVYEKVCIDETRGSLFRKYCRFPDGGCRNPGPLTPGEYLVNCLCRGTGDGIHRFLYKPTDFPSVSEFKAKCDPAP